MGKVIFCLSVLMVMHFSVSRANPAVSLVDFQVVWLEEEEFAQLNWATDHEQNFSHFVVERSVDGQNWEAIEQIESRGADSTLTNYNCKDRLPLDGNNYYRLRMVDQNNQEDFSEVKVIAAEIDDPKWLLFPNPSHDFLFLKHPEFDPSDFRLEVWNFQGLNVELNPEVELSGLRVDLKDLSAGYYILRMRMNGVFQNLRFVKW
jgi:hypothetical protein